MAVRLPILDGAPLSPVLSPGENGTADAQAGEGGLLRVGDLARETSKTVRALHLYEELGLLSPVERSKGGFRLYAQDAVLRVRWITKLQDMGFSLPDIREILHQWERSHSAMDAMRHIQTVYQQKLEETDRQIERLKALRSELAASVSYIASCDVCDPVRLIDACPHCDLHGCHAPELVAGLHSKH